MGVIFALSTNLGASTNTRPMVSGIVQRLFPALAARLDAQTLYRINYDIRKTAHVTEYAILAILSYRAVAFGNPRFRDRNVLGPLILGVLYAAGDEFHQSFVPSRDSEAGDILFDASGVLLGVLLCLWAHCRRDSGQGVPRPDTECAIPFRQ
jgi:VanZ family protein